MSRVELPLNIPNDQILAVMARKAAYPLKLEMQGGRQRPAIGIRDHLAEVSATGRDRSRRAGHHGRASPRRPPRRSARSGRIAGRRRRLRPRAPSSRDSRRNGLVRDEFRVLRARLADAGLVPRGAGFPLRPDKSVFPRRGRGQGRLGRGGGRGQGRQEDLRPRGRRLRDPRGRGGPSRSTISPPRRTAAPASAAADGSGAGAAGVPAGHRPGLPGDLRRRRAPLAAEPQRGLSAAQGVSRHLAAAHRPGDGGPHRRPPGDRAALRRRRRRPWTRPSTGWPPAPATRSSSIPTTSAWSSEMHPHR